MGITQSLLLLVMLLSSSVAKSGSVSGSCPPISSDKCRKSVCEVACQCQWGMVLGSEKLKHFEEELKVCLDINGTLLCGQLTVHVINLELCMQTSQEIRTCESRQ